MDKLDEREYWAPEHVREHLRSLGFHLPLEPMEGYIREWHEWMQALGTYEFAFDGVQPNGTVAVGSLGCVRDREAREVFESGFRTMIEVVTPKTVIVYGAIELAALNDARSTGVEIIGFEDATTSAHRKKGSKHGVR